LTPACLFFDNNRQLSWGPHCTDDSIIKGWMWKPQAQLNPAEMLFEHYSQSRQTGRSYVLNVGPDTTGRISDDQIAVLAQLKDMIANRPLTQSAAANPPAAQPAAADRLKQLKDLYDQGLITKDDYDKKVKAILDSM
jgi:alpha-L-fucosidase